jgi:hypothetical protein
MSMPVQLRFLKNRDAVARNLEAAAPGRDQIDLDVRPSFFQLRRQPGSAWLVVSKSAVFDRDFFHRFACLGQLDVTPRDVARKNSMR